MPRSRVLLFFALASIAAAPARGVAATLDARPVVSAPARVDGAEGAPLGFDVTVTEPDGDEIIELRAEGVPSGSTFRVEPSNAAARFDWTPAFDQAGSFAIRITARSLSRAVSVSEPIPLEGVATVDVVVANVNRPPVIVPIPDVAVSGGASATIQMLATDPDGGGAFAYSLVSGPPYVSRINASLYMAPALADTGEADAVYSISDGEAAAIGSVHVIVTGAPPCAGAPVLVSPPYRVLIDASRDEGLWWAPQDVSYDPALPHIGRRLAENLRGRGIEVIELGRRNAGVLTPVISFQTLAGFDLVIRPNGLLYAASELGAYSCYLANGGRLVLLSDALPPGRKDILATWLGLDFRGESRGENRIATYSPHPITEGVGPLVYGVGSGLFAAPPSATLLGNLSAATFVDLDGDAVQDPGEPAGATVMGVVRFGNGLCFFLGDTSMFLGVPHPLFDNLLRYMLEDHPPPPLAARAFLPDGHRTIPLGAGSAAICVQVEPAEGAYENADVDPSRWTMVADAAGVTRSIAAVQGKAAVVADRDRNGVQEMTVCFRREDLGSLSPDFRGRGELPVRIEGALLGGARVQAPLTLTVVGLGAGRQALVTPNPARGSATLLFHTEAASPVTIRLFDARGRLVRRIRSNAASGVGYHEAALEARGADGTPLPSGAYFYSIDAPEGRTTGRWIVIR